ncbi:MAG: Fe3+ siderophore transporter, inner rane subunit [Dehalococcoidia bacterium]|nr:Fe3+ siderophore transporter, inner rane subunit [Dehalococcoidia bacterium]
MFSRRGLLMISLLLVVGFLVVYPLFMLVYGSFRGGGPGTEAPLSLDGYRIAYTNPSTYKVLWTTMWLGVVRTIITMILSVFLAWVVTRTDTPWRGGLEVLVWTVFVLPLLPVVVSWTLLAGPRGFINQGLMSFFHLSNPPFDIYSYGGIIWVSVIFWASIIFILITPAFRGMDASLEESSRMSGASGLTTIRRITIPVLMPAILGATVLVFIRFLESFEIELFLGYGARIYVYTTRIWLLLGLAPADYPQAMALSTMFLGLIFILIYIQWKLIGQKQYTTVTGRGFATRVTRLGKWKYVTFAIVILYFIVGVILPLLTLILGSFMRIWGVWVADPFTVKHWIATFNDPRFLPSLRNTMYVGIGSATLGMIFYSLLSYIIVRSQMPAKKTLDFITWLPWGVPGLVLALGFLWAYVGGIPFLSALFGTIWLLMLVLIVSRLPLGVRVMNGAMYQFGKELEESSRVLGASWFYTFRRVIAPLLTPAFLSTWIILFLTAVRDLVTVVFLYTPPSRLISITLLEHWIGGEYERATVVGLIMSVVILVIALGARWLGTKTQMPTV